MNFHERNLGWDGHGKRTFLQPHSRSSTPRLWSVWVVKNVIHTEWGQLGGALQQATDISQGVNIGKKNEMSPAAYALDRAKELCRKKDWEGYREADVAKDGSILYLDAIVDTNINFDDLPLGLCFYKPDNTMGAGITKKALAGNVLYTRKRNGMAFVLARGKDHPRLYSRRLLRQHDDEVGTSLTWNDRFPHLIEAAAQFMPENSIILGELVLDKNNQDDFNAVQSYTKSLTLQSVEDQKKFGPASFYIWDIAFWHGQDLVSKTPVGERYLRIHEIDGGRFFIPIEICTPGFRTPEDAVAFAKKNEWEGFVVVDPEGIYGDRAYNFKGKPDRPGAVCAKLKPEYEDDFIAFWDPEKGYGERSTKGRNNQGIKSVALYQYNSKGEMVYISNVSSGLTDAQKKEWADPSKYPMVWKIIYTERTYISQGDDTNALTFARFDSQRTDKRVEECINPRL